MLVELKVTINHYKTAPQPHSVSFIKDNDLEHKKEYGNKINFVDVEQNFEDIYVQGLKDQDLVKKVILKDKERICIHGYIGKGKY